jgi:ATP-dependent RNA helicase RhlE
MENYETGFHGLGIAPGILKVLERLNFKNPTPIQKQSIPAVMEGKDIMGIAQTGTGKTLAFGIPLIQKTMSGGLGLVIVPTRELATQVNESLESVGRALGLRTATLIGGEPIGRQLRSLARNPHIIIGTPGRIIDHLAQKSLKLAGVTMLVLDEADRMLDMGFAPQLKKIMAVMPKKRQTMLFSATMPDEIVSMARAYLEIPIRVEIARAGSAAEKVTQELFFVPQENKIRLLEKLAGDYRGSILVFTRTKFGAKKIAAKMRALGHTCSEIHSNRSLNQRRDALEGFKTGRYRVLVATDIAARGIDVSDIEVVVNYDLPSNSEDYVHRIGRTARAGKSGHAVSFARPNEINDVRAIERLTRSKLPVSKLPILPQASSAVPAGNFQRPPRGEHSDNHRFQRGFRRSRKGFSHKFRHGPGSSGPTTAGQNA